MTSTIDTIPREHEPLTSATTQPACVPAVPPDVRAAHVDVADIVAELDLDDAALWAQAAEIVSDVVTEANDVTAVLTGTPSGTTATAVPPIVRVRELATAQRRLFRAMESRTAPDHRLAISAERIHRLGQWLEHLAGYEGEETLR